MDNSNQQLREMKSKKAKVDMLKLQINFRRKVLNQIHAENQVFQFSRNRKALTVEELAQNSCKLLLNNLSCTCQPSTSEVLRNFCCIKESNTFLIVTALTCGIKEQCYHNYDKDSGEFRVVYNNEDEVHVYCFPLIDDLRIELKIV